ncbi:MAG: hypothetical protein IPM64_07960 [Phycisphaerales bacterium]|nr:hypothetical protein [Phycisphaerales bacterium]
MEIRVVGVHPVPCSAEEFESAVEIMRGSDRTPEERVEDRERVRGHFDGLRLIVIEVAPPDAEIDWGAFTQSIPGKERQNWQAAYDEELVDPERGRWAFYLHYVRPDQPLLTQVGDLTLPAATPLPPELAWKQYFVP